MSDEVELGQVDSELVRAIEGILMVAVEPVQLELMAKILEIPTELVGNICGRLASIYAEAGHGFQLVQVAGGYRFQSHPEVASYVERFVLDGQPSRISPAALETLAIIAYKQPISRAQIAAIRGVDPETVIRTLHARGYISEVERLEGQGSAILFGTTPLFLERLGIGSVQDLPSIADFIPDAEIVETLERSLRVSVDDNEQFSAT